MEEPSASSKREKDEDGTTKKAPPSNSEKSTGMTAGKAPRSSFSSKATNKNGRGAASTVPSVRQVGFGQTVSFESEEERGSDPETRETDTTSTKINSNDSSFTRYMQEHGQMKRFSNRFQEKRMERFYQLYTSDHEFQSARKKMIILIVYQILIYVGTRNTYANFFLSENEKTVSEQTVSFMKTLAYSTIPYSQWWNYTMTGAAAVFFWSFLPLSIIFAFFPLKKIRFRLFERFIREKWKYVCVLLVFIWYIGNVMRITRLFKLGEHLFQDKFNGEYNCTTVSDAPSDWFPSSSSSYTLSYWLILKETHLFVSDALLVITFLLSMAGTMCLALNLDFFHVLICLVISYGISIALPYYREKVDGSGGTAISIIFHIITIVPVLLVLFVSYNADRASRYAYLGKLRAERENTKLKVELASKDDLVRKNYTITAAEQTAVDDVLGKSKDNELLHEVSIPFSSLELKDLLHEGEKGDILLADYYGTEVVLKRLDQVCFTNKELKIFKSKVELLACLRHPNILLFIGATFDNPSNIGLVLEYMERGDVAALLQSDIAFSWTDPLLKIAIDVAQGMSYLHNSDPSVVHRDLKCSNLLCTPTFSCKVADFGESTRQLTGRSLRSVVGTPYWLAPEVIREEKYDSKVDCYSFGIVMIELETRKEPYYDVSAQIATMDVLVQVAQKNLRPAIPASCLPQRRALIERCLHEDPNERPTMDEILNCLQNEVRTELFESNETENSDDRMMVLQNYQKLNRQGVREALENRGDYSSSEAFTSSQPHTHNT